MSEVGRRSDQDDGDPARNVERLVKFIAPFAPLPETTEKYTRLRSVPNLRE